MEQIGAYEIQYSIGKGSFGVVKCATKASDLIGENLSYALKICRKNQLKKIKLCEYDLSGNLLRYTGVQKFEKECAILESLRHPNIVRFHETFQDDEEDFSVLVTLYVPLGPVMHFEAATQQYVYNSALVQRHNAVFEVDDVLRLFRDVVQAVAYLHRHNVCHRDLKPANILISSSFSLVLCDFGVAEQFNTSTEALNEHNNNLDTVDSARQLNPAGMVSNTTGSPADWAPEGIFPERFSTDCGLDLSQDFDALGLEDDTANNCDAPEKAARNKIARFSAYGLDMWAMGVLLYELFYLHHPFYMAELSEIELFERIAEHDPLAVGSLDGHAAETNTSSTNWSVKNACSHSPVHDSVGMVDVRAPDKVSRLILEGLLQKEPSMRWSIDTLLELPALA